MRNELVHRALEKVVEPEILINMISMRVRQLGQGFRPLIIASPRMTLMDVALTEVAEGKLSFEYMDAPVAKA
jgi:DNA-directed RNA polymerase subunit omega